MEGNYKDEREPTILGVPYSELEGELRNAYVELERIKDPIERECVELLIHLAEKRYHNRFFD
ncbi:hypothetical protein HYV89_04810 [Candidatus Woesearchaeota archaeon]|nr:hypothetical protein [Candidatus Woesearchaeota archaeon]